MEGRASGLEPGLVIAVEERADGREDARVVGVEKGALGVVECGDVEGVRVDGDEGEDVEVEEGLLGGVPFGSVVGVARRDGADFVEVLESDAEGAVFVVCLLYTSPSPRDQRGSRMPSSA